MNAADNDDQEVRPLGTSEIGRKRERRNVGAIVIMAAAGIAALVLFTGSEPDSGTDAFPSPSRLPAPGGSALSSESIRTIPPSTSTELQPTTDAGELTLRDLLPEVRGELVAVVSQTGGSGQELVRWVPNATGPTREMPILEGPVLGFDQSGQYLAFLGPSSLLDGPTLYFGGLDSWAPARVGVTSFRWHETLWRQIGWFEPGEPPRLCWADADVGAEILSGAECVEGAGTELVGFDSEGFFVTDRAAGTVSLIDAAGRPVRSVPGFDALIGPDGRVLIVERSPAGGDTVFSLASPDLAEVVGLDWAPGNAAGEFGVVAWSPVRPLLAFLVNDVAEQPRLELWNSDGKSLANVTLTGRVWDVTWDSTGRYLLIPGVLDEQQHFLQIYDAFAGTLVDVKLDGWIQNASLVVAASCRDAAHVEGTFTDRLPDGVSLTTPRMVRSRDAHLQPWYFVSARVVGGPFDGEIASWALPGFDGTSVDNTNTPSLSVPINQAASSLGFGMTHLDPASYGMEDWLQIDGALASQACLQERG